MSKSKVFVGVALALTATLGVGVAQARNVDVQWFVMIGTPIYAQPAPVLVRPLPVYRQPAPSRPRATHLQPTRWDRDGDGIPNRRDRHAARGWPARQS